LAVVLVSVYYALRHTIDINCGCRQGWGG
jgi:tRNA-dihydrouridine synthase